MKGSKGDKEKLLSWFNLKRDHVFQKDHCLWLNHENELEEGKLGNMETSCGHQAKNDGIMNHEGGREDGGDVTDSGYSRDTTAQD